MRKIILTWLVLCTALFGGWQASAKQNSGAGCSTPGLNISIGFCNGGVFSLTNTATDSQVIASGTSATFSSESFGVADSTRKIIVATSAFSSVGSFTISSMTVGGISATNVVNTQNAAGFWLDGEIWIASVPTGTSGSVVINYSGAVTPLVGISLYSMVNQSGSSAITGVDGGSGANTTRQATLSIPSGGASVGTGYFFTTTAPTMSSAPSGFNLDANIQVGAFNNQNYVASHAAAGVLTGSQTLSFTATGGTPLQNTLAAFAAWGP